MSCARRYSRVPMPRQKPGFISGLVIFSSNKIISNKQRMRFPAHWRSIGAIFHRANDCRWPSICPGRTAGLQMAIYLSWADRLNESKDELTKLLAEDPKNIAARTHLARVLSWSGELRAAVVQADQI